MSRDFLQALWTPGAGYGEIRAIKPFPGSRPQIAQEFFPLADPFSYDAAVETARHYDLAGYDVYCGVLRRTTQGGKAMDVVDHAPVLWADIDPYKEPKLPVAIEDRGISQPFYLLETLAFPIPPSIIVDSGHGIHAYWLLRDAAPVGDAQLAMKGIAKAIGGDHTHDPARVLRVPSTYNHKRPGEEVPVRLLRLDTTRRYRFSDFSEYIDLATEGQRGTPAKWAQTYERRADLPPWLDELIANGVSRGQRSTNSYKVAIWLIHFGYSDEEIRQVFASTPAGIGEKYAELGDRWLNLTLRAARSVA